MSNEPNYRFPVESGAAVELTASQYALLVDERKGKLTPRMLIRLSKAAQLLAAVEGAHARTLMELVRLIHDDAEAVPSNMERRAMVALTDAGLVQLIGKANQARYILAGPKLPDFDREGVTIG